MGQRFCRHWQCTDCLYSHIAMATDKGRKPVDGKKRKALPGDAAGPHKKHKPFNAAQEKGKHEAHKKPFKPEIKSLSK